MRSALILFGLNEPGPFLREPFKTIEDWGFGQVIILIPTRPCFRFSRTPKGSTKVGAKRTKFERSDSAIRARASRAHRRINSWSCNGLFSPGNSLQGSISTFKRSAFVPYPTLRTSFPLPSSQALLHSIGAGPTATGRLHCSHHNFLRVAHATLYCKRDSLGSNRERNFLRLAANRDCYKLQRPVESGPFCGKPLRMAERPAVLADSGVSNSRLQERRGPHVLHLIAAEVRDRIAGRAPLFGVAEVILHLSRGAEGNHQPAGCRRDR